MLFDPLEIKTLKLKNRIIMPAVNLGWSKNGEVNEQIINFYRERARGGAGLIITGGTAIEESVAASGNMISLHDDKLIASHKKLCKSLKNEGTHPGTQLFHSGRYSFSFMAGNDVVAPSAVASRLTGHTPRELDTHEVYKIISSFGDAASRAKEAGYEVIEVIMSAGYLVSQFCSPLTNKRTDEFGGSLEKRMRFPIEIIKDIRSKVGPDTVLSVRLGASDFMENGNHWEEISVLARELENASVNLINVTGGWHESYIPQIQAEVPRGTYSYLAAAIKEAVTIPVSASNRINEPAVAEEILQSGQADLISIARGFIADPYWALKASNGQDKSIRKCIACMNCLDNLFSDQGICCAINPDCGKEGESTTEVSSQSKKVLLIGAGPAGLEAARTAALKGHQVKIWEKEATAGGQWNIASVPPGKKEFQSLLDFYQTEMERLQVEISYNKTADLNSIVEESPDAVILATGAAPTIPPIAVQDDAKVINSWDVLKGKSVKGKNIVVIGGGSVGCETALYLAEKGTLDAESLRFLLLHQAEKEDTLYDLLTRGSYHVSIVEMGPSLAADMGKGIRWTVMKHLRAMGIDSYTSRKVSEIRADGVIVLDQDNNEMKIPADTVVLATGSKSCNSLYAELKEKFDELYIIGDAVKPGKVKNAIHQAHDIASNL